MMPIRGMQYTAAAVFLLLCTIMDLKARRISLSAAGVFAAAGLVLSLAGGGTGLSALLYDLTPGVLLLLLAYVSRESMGYGDGIAVLVLGLLLGAGRCYAAVVLGLLFSGLFSLVLLVLRKAGRKSRIPYLPFLTLGTGVAAIVIRQ